MHHICPSIVLQPCISADSLLVSGLIDSDLLRAGRVLWQAERSMGNRSQWNPIHEINLSACPSAVQQQLATPHRRWPRPKVATLRAAGESQAIHLNICIIPTHWTHIHFYFMSTTLVFPQTPDLDTFTLEDAKHESVVVMYHKHGLVRHRTNTAAIFGGTWEGWPATPLCHGSATEEEHHKFHCRSVLVLQLI